MNKFTSLFKLLFTIMVLLLLACNNGFAQSTDSVSVGTLTLDQCISIAHKQSSEANAARFALIASKWRFKSFRADLLPSLSLSGDAPNYRKAISSNRRDDGTYTYTSSTQSDASANISLEQNILPTGGTIALQSGLSRLGIFEGENTYLWQSTPLVAVLTQPLFQFNNLKWQNKTEPLLFEIAQKEYVQDMEDISASVTNGFFDVYLAKINLENAKFNVTKNDSIYQISKGRYNVGSIAENDLLQSELELRNAQSSLSTAKIEYRRALNDFKIQLGYPTDVSLNLKPPKRLPKIDVDIDKARQLALKNNSESLNYKLNEIQAKRQLAQQQKQAGFSATVRATYGLNQTAEDFDKLYDNPENRQSFTVGFNIPIFNWGKERAEVNAARNEQRQVANNIKVQRRRFIQRVDYKVSQFLQLRQQTLLAAKADTIGQRRYEVAQNRYVIGKIDVTNLFIAQNEKDSARRAYIRALNQFWSGWYSLRQLTLYNFQEDKPISYDLN